MRTHAVAASSALLLDRLLGEPPNAIHPVVWFGRTMGRFESVVYADRRRSGVAHTAIGVGIGLGTGLVTRRLLGPGAATALATSICVAGRMLDEEAAAVASLLRADDLDGARHRLRSLVGRDTSQLDEAAVSRAVIESVAENGVDAVTASWWWASVGGAPAVLAHRAANTLDAMVGHRNERYERFGWASARLDDLLNHLPARLTAVAVATVRPARARDVLRAVRHDARHHPSPNGGVVEAAFAGALGVRLGGANRYGDVVEDRGTLGDGRTPKLADIDRALRLRRDATAALAIAGSIVTAAATTLRRRSATPT